jgi:hypothetical protein
VWRLALRGWTRFYNSSISAQSQCIATAAHFRKLRALIIKELHPDYAPADSVDRALRAEAFKVIWSKIEALSTEA